MTACERATNLFGRAWDDELTAAERDGLERHFAACTPCRREYDELARTLELVQALPRPVVDDGFAVRVLAQAQARERAGEFAGRRLFALPAAWSALSFGRQAVAMAATFVVALGLGAYLMNRPMVAPGPSSREPSVAILAEPGPTTPAPADVNAPVGTAGERVAPRSDERVASSPPAAAPAPRRVAPEGGTAPAVAAATTPATEAGLDSLFDHSEDVELVLDPVRLRRERGRGYTPASPSVRGEAASITF
jgi:anti-sigma factor RsiW